MACSMIAVSCLPRLNYYSFVLHRCTQVVRSELDGIPLELMITENEERNVLISLNLGSGFRSQGGVERMPLVVSVFRLRERLSLSLHDRALSARSYSIASVAWNKLALSP